MCFSVRQVGLEPTPLDFQSSVITLSTTPAYIACVDHLGNYSGVTEGLLKSSKPFYSKLSHLLIFFFCGPRRYRPDLIFCVTGRWTLYASPWPFICREYRIRTCDQLLSQQSAKTTSVILSYLLVLRRRVYYKTFKYRFSRQSNLLILSIPSRVATIRTWGLYIPNVAP